MGVDGRHCPHRKLQGIYGEDAIQIGCNLQCLDCGAFLIGPPELVDLPTIVIRDQPSMWPDAVELIRIERERQKAKGHTANSDDLKPIAVFHAAGMAYYRNDIRSWPFAKYSFHPRGEFRNLIRAGALFIAGNESAVRTYGMVSNLNSECYNRTLKTLDRLLWEVSEAVGGPVEKKEEWTDGN